MRVTAKAVAGFSREPRARSKLDKMIVITRSRPRTSYLSSYSVACTHTALVGCPRADKRSVDGVRRVDRSHQEASSVTTKSFVMVLEQRLKPTSATIHSHCTL
jgi:hypothetical protein